MMEVYKITSTVNCADTMRDPDDLHVEDLGYKEGKDNARKFCEEHIKNRFVKENTQLEETDYGFKAVDFCSYGATLKAELIKIT